jgi:hypothetical protein
MIQRLHVPVTQPEDVRPHLAKKEHWRTGYSAQELAVAWCSADNDFPPAVKATLNTAREYSSAKLVDGFFEREVELGSPGRNSQTDLMALVDLGDRLGVVAVEGKVEEPFSNLVREWNGTPGKALRLRNLCKTLALDPNDVANLRYQLLHRTASAIYEAKRYHCKDALMLVHSFSSTHRWFEDFVAFSISMGIPIAHPDICSSPKVCEGVSLRLAWVTDSARTHLNPELLTVKE